MSSAILKPSENKTSLPDDIFIYHQDQFYEFIEQTCGDDVAELLRFQAIRSGMHLLDTSCDDILLVLEEQSEEIDKLKKMCCFEIADNKHKVKLGVRIAINSLIQSLKFKREQQQKKKRSSNRHVVKSVSQIIPSTQTDTQNTTSSPELILTASSIVDTSRETTSANKLKDIDHKLDIVKRINKWWTTTIQNDDDPLEEGKHFFLTINKSNDKSTCILACRCYARFRLPFMKSGVFKISSFYRHLKEKQCMHHFNTVSISQRYSSTVIKFYIFRNPKKKMFYLPMTLQLIIKQQHHLSR